LVIKSKESKMRKLSWLPIVILLFVSSLCQAQYTTVTATVVDSDSTVWANAPYSFSFQPGPNQSNPAGYTYNGAALDAAHMSGSGAANGSGVISLSMYQNTLLSPVPSSYNLTVCPNASSKCSTVNFSTSSGSVDLSAQINAAITAPRFQANGNVYGYTDAEAILQLKPGNSYWNVTSSATRTWDGTKWVTSGGTGALPLTGGTLTGTVNEYGQIYDAKAIGMTCNGVADDVPALSAFWAARQVAGQGATVRIPVGACVFASHLVLPNDNVSGPTVGVNGYSHQVPLRLTGVSPDLRDGQRNQPQAPYQGSTILMAYNSTATGPLAEQSVFAGGSGYAVGDTGTVGGTCSGATYRVVAVDTGTYKIGTALSTLTHAGYVEQVLITDNGTGCTRADNVATSTGGSQAGSGTGLTLNIAAVTGAPFAKIETYGLGSFEMDNLTLIDTGTDALPFLRTTGTTLKVHENLFWGTGAGSPATQEAIHLGGCSNEFVSLNNPIAFFQGYNTVITDNVFHGFRRVTYTEGFNAAAMIFHNYADVNGVGSDLPEGAAFESNGPAYDCVSFAASNGNAGENMYIGNRVEMNSYPFAFKFFGSDNNYIAATDIEDVGTAGLTPKAFIFYQGYSTYNEASVHISNGLPVALEDVSSANSNVLVTTVQNVPSIFPQGLQTPLFTAAPATAVYVRPGAGSAIDMDVQNPGRTQDNLVVNDNGLVQVFDTLDAPNITQNGWRLFENSGYYYIRDNVNGLNVMTFYPVTKQVDMYGPVNMPGITGHGSKGPVCTDATGLLYVGNNSGVGAPCP